MRLWAQVSARATYKSKKEKEGNKILVTNDSLVSVHIINIIKFLPKSGLNLLAFFFLNLKL